MEACDEGSVDSAVGMGKKNPLSVSSVSSHPTFFDSVKGLWHLNNVRLRQPIFQSLAGGPFSLGKSAM
jgi:hypothetical protein